MGRKNSMIRSKTRKVLEKLGGNPELIRLIGYSDGNDDYKKAKQPVPGEQVRISLDEAEDWLSEGGWIGLYFPKAYILIDIDHDETGIAVYKSLKNGGVKFVGIKTPNGYQLLFKKGFHIEKQTAKTMTLGGIVVDYRITGKGYTVLPTENTKKRKICFTPKKELSAMPALFRPARQKKSEEGPSLIELPIEEGRRDDTMFRHACRLVKWNKQYRLSLSDEDISEVVVSMNDFFCDPPLDQREIETKLSQALKHKEVDDYIPEEWEEPLSLDSMGNNRPFPIKALPINIQRVVRDMSNVVCVDKALPASIILSILSACLAKKYIVNGPTHFEQVNLYICPVLPSGERKSEVIKALTDPVYSYEKLMQEEIQQSSKEISMERSIKEQLLKGFERKLRSGKAIKEDVVTQIREIQKELDGLIVPKPPVYIVGDVTTEKLGVLMSENNERISMISAEGDIFKTMAGRYNKDSNIELYLKAHTGDACRLDRIGRDPFTLKSPVLTICVTLQPNVVVQLGSNAEFWDRGLLGRILFCHCKPQAGSRKVKSKEEKKQLSKSLKEYSKFICALMEIPIKTKSLKLTKKAEQKWSAFHDNNEKELCRGGKLDDMPGWGSKLPGTVLRIAALLHVAKHIKQAKSMAIEKETMQNAIKIGGFFMDQAIYARRAMRVDQRCEAAQKILGILERSRMEEFTIRVLMRSSGFKSSSEINPGIEMLLEYGYIRKKPNGQRSVGRPAGITYEVNPKIFIGKIS